VTVLLDVDRDLARQLVGALQAGDRVALLTAEAQALHRLAGLELPTASRPRAPKLFLVMFCSGG
jgi:hypothetical protein